MALRELAEASLQGELVVDKNDGRWHSDELG